jgi:predicted transcriptional regulator
VPRKSLYLPEGLWEKIEPEAKTLDRSVSWWVSRAVEEKLEREATEARERAGGKS